MSALFCFPVCFFLFNLMVVRQLGEQTSLRLQKRNSFLDVYLTVCKPFRFRCQFGARSPINRQDERILERRADEDGVVPDAIVRAMCWSKTCLSFVKLRLGLG